jgi:hypothetical protein
LVQWKHKAHIYEYKLKGRFGSDDDVVDYHWEGEERKLGRRRKWNDSIIQPVWPVTGYKETSYI